MSLQGNTIRFSPVTLAESAQLRLTRLYERTLYKEALAVVSVGRPSTAKFGGEQLRDEALLTWCAEVIETLLG